MTTAIFLILFFGFFIGVLNWLPDADSANSLLVSSWQFLIGNLKAWNWLIPVNELIVCVGIVIAYEILRWSWFHVLIPVTKMLRGTTH